MLIEVVSYSGKRQWIESKKIMGVSLGKDNPGLCVVHLQNTGESEDWMIKEDADILVKRINSANSL